MRSYTSVRKKQNCGVVPRVWSRKANTLGKTLDQLYSCILISDSELSEKEVSLIRNY